jgi:hypothetical protein
MKLLKPVAGVPSAGFVMQQNLEAADPHIYPLTIEKGIKKLSGLTDVPADGMLAGTRMFVSEPGPTVTDEFMPYIATLLDSGNYRLNFAIPLYKTPPATIWNDIIALGAPKVPLISITVDAAQDGAGGIGPGTAPSSAFLTAMASAQATGIKVVGYVSTLYSCLGFTAVALAVARFYEFYPDIDGIFFDQIEASPQGYQFLAAIAGEVRKHDKRFIVMNPGAYAAEGIMQFCDVLLDRETNAATYLTENTPEWRYNYPAHRFWHAIHTCTSQAQMDSVIKRAVQQNTGYIFVTDGVMNYPYAALPAWWAAEKADQAATSSLDLARDYIPGSVLDVYADFVTKDGSNKVSQLTDQSCGGFNLTQGTGANQPTWVDAQLNGKPILRFTGSQWLQHNSFSQTLKCTVWAVFKTTSDNRQYVISGSYGDEGIIVAANRYPGIRHPNDKLSSVAIGSNWTAVLAVMTTSNYLSGLWVNGVLQNNNSAGTYYQNLFALGSIYGGASTGFIGDIAAAGVFNRALGSDDIAKFFAWAKTHYGI